MSVELRSETPAAHAVENPYAPPESNVEPERWLPAFAAVQPKKPGALVLALAVALLSGLLRTATVLAGAYVLATRPDVAVGPAVAVLAVSSIALAYASYVMFVIGRGGRGGYRPVVLYPLFGIALYVAEKVLTSSGIYPPAERLPLERMFGSALYEAARYAVLIGLFAWLSLSKAARRYLAGERGLPDR